MSEFSRVFYHAAIEFLTLEDFSAAAVASSNNQSSETSVAAHEIWKFQTKLWSIEVLALISAPGISIYNGPLLMIKAHCYVITAHPQVMYQGLIYVDRMINKG